jgi:ataxia telangiectasia mutated family protein
METKTQYVLSECTDNQISAITRLIACGKALRTTVSAGAKRLRAKTVKAVVDHILQTLPTSDGPYCPGLALDYVKSLRIILEFQPHVEHFRELWQDVLDFCIEGIAPSQSGDDEDESQATTGASLPTTSMSLSRRSRAATPQAMRSKRVNAFRREADDLVACIYQLVRATNAPVAGNELNVVEALQTFLKFSDSVRLSYNEAFSGINSIMSRAAISSVELTSSMVFSLIPLVKDLWMSKSSSLKEEIIITLVLTKDHVSALMEDPAQATFRLDVENLLETLQLDYSKRIERDQLQLSDLVLDCSTSMQGKSNLRLPCFALRHGRIRAEGLWTILHLIASYTSALDKRKLALHSGATTNGTRDDTAAKRPRLTLLYQDVLRQAASSPTPATRIANLQYLCFLFQISPFSEAQVEEVVTTLVGALSDQNPMVARWAILALASCAIQTSAKSIAIHEHWANVLMQAARLITVERCSRTACHLLHVLVGLNILSYGDVAAVAETMFGSIELQGPTSVSDASLALLGWLLEARAAENPSTATATAERLVQWLFQKWTPGTFHDREVAAQIVSNCRPHDVVRFLSQCCGLRRGTQTLSFDLCGPITQAWYKMSNVTDLTDFLLLRDKKDFLSEATSKADDQTEDSSRAPLSVLVQAIDALEAETGRVLASWTDMVYEKPQALLPDMFSTVASLILINAAVVRNKDDRAKRRIEALRKKGEALVKALTDCLSRADCELEKVDSVLSTLGNYLPRFQDIQASDENISADDPLISLSVHLATALERRHQAKTAAAISQDGMDLDDGFESQHSEATAAIDADKFVRDIVAVTTDPNSYRRCITAHAQLITAVLQTSVDSAEMKSVSTVPSSFVAYMTELSPQELFSCRPVLLTALATVPSLGTDDAESLFDHLASFLEAYEYSRHEVALLLHVDLLQACLSNWTMGEDQSLADTAAQGYEWFVDTALTHNICSSAVKVGIAKLLFELLKVKGPGYRPTETVHSVRTSLFELLKTGDISVIYCVIQDLANVFNHFTLETHEDIFNDLHEHSMFAETWLEGNALRMLMFSSLGSQWHTLLRRCLYHIFETAGFLPRTSPYATRCIQGMADHLKLAESQSLFRLFAGQLMYTWTRQIEGSWDNIPFAIFGYDTLRSLLYNVREEVYAQLLMRNDSEELVKTSAKIGLGQAELAKSSFPRSAAYSLAWDAEMKSKRPAEKDRSETRLRGLIGAKYSAKCLAHFPKMLGLLLLRTNFEKKQQLKDALKSGESGQNGHDEQDDKEPVETMLEKRISTEEAAKRDCSFETAALNAFKAMRTISSSNIRLPDPTQPMFRPKIFMDVVHRLARRVRKNSLQELLEPAVYVFILRLLLSHLHDSLGSLHACLIVRKIRALVALSGQAAMIGYPLEITLHSLRPLLTDNQCAEDALGIVQYLYTKGIDYLKQELNFVAGMNVTTLISLRKFVGSSQESTTQESQHIATINRANTFRKWLVESWSRTFSEGLDDNPLIQAYLRMMAYAYSAGAKANATDGTAESNLMWQILDDRRSGRSLLQGATWNLALNLLCSAFEEPISYRADILGLDSLAKSYVADVWTSCKDTHVNPRYVQWAARVLGRASHHVEFDAKALLQYHTKTSLLAEQVETERTSQAVIIDAIADLLLSGSRVHAGLAEETLRLILVRVNKSETSQNAMAELQEQLSGAVLHGLALMTEDTVVPLSILEPLPLEACFTSTKEEYDVWLRHVAHSLIVSNADEPIVGTLGRLISGVHGIAEVLFAPILHLVLKQDLMGKGLTRNLLSHAYKQWLSNPPPSSEPHVRALLKTILYLRKQPYPQEATHADRLKWLDVDFTVAAEAAEKCGMHTAALLFAELTSFMQPLKGSRRSTTTVVPAISEDTMLAIYRNIDDPDSFYGVPQPPSLDLVLSRFDHEAEGFKGLMFRGAKLDSQMRRAHEISADENGALIKSLVGINMNTLTYNLLSGRNASSNALGMVEPILQTAMRLEQWDVRVPDSAMNDTATLYKVYQSLNNSTDLSTVRKELDSGLLRTMHNVMIPSIVERTFRSSLCTLGILTEIDDLITSTSPEQLEDAWSNMHSREASLLSSSLTEVKSILSSREILLGTICSNTALREAMHINLRDIRKLQVDALLSSCRVWKRRQGLQQSLDTVTYLSDLVPLCAEVGLDISCASQNEVADVLWSQGEYSTSVRMLQQIMDGPMLKGEAEEVQRPNILAKLGHHVAEARLEPPNQIMNKYLMPAISDLKGHTKGAVAGQVFHQFADFCYEQLQNQENVNDLERAAKVRSQQKVKVEALTAEIKAMRSQTERNNRKHDLTKAQRWLKLDSLEHDRLRRVREKFMEQCLENYLLSLAASDEHDNDALRFYAIWLDNAVSELANATVQKHLGKIVSAKFARLMNQLSSRLQADSTHFQKLLNDLVFRICREHPFHGMHHITASTHDPGTDDEASRSRHNAAKQIAARLKVDKSVVKLWQGIYRSDRIYHDVARYTDEEVQRSGREIRLDQIEPTKRMQEQIAHLQTPPPTFSIPLRADTDYKDVPRVIGFQTSMRVASGLSAPKIITSKLSDGSKFKQLVRSAVFK